MDGCPLFSLKAGKKRERRRETREEIGEKELLLLATHGYIRKNWFSVKEAKTEQENVLHSVIPKVGG